MTARLLLLACAAALGVSACALPPPSVGTSRQTPRSGGSAGQMGPGYCHTVPAELTARAQWNDLCFGRN